MHSAVRRVAGVGGACLLLACSGFATNNVAYMQNAPSVHACSRSPCDGTDTSSQFHLQAYLSIPVDEDFLLVSQLLLPSPRKEGLKVSRLHEGAQAHRILLPSHVELYYAVLYASYLVRGRCSGLVCHVRWPNIHRGGDAVPSLANGVTPNGFAGKPWRARDWPPASS